MSDYQVMPPLSGDEFESLKADIEARGVLVPVEYDESGNILDGHHRVRICGDLGISAWPRLVRKGFSEDEKRAHARSLNLARRHLNQKQKRDLIRDQLKDTPEKSNRQIAKALGVHQTTVGTQRKALEDSGEVSKLDSSIGADGKKRPRATKPKTVYLSEDDVRKTENLPESHKAAVLSGDMKQAHAAADAREQAAKQRLQAEPPVIPDGLHIGDFRDYANQIPDDSIELIFTDPPYDRESIPLFGNLAEIAARVLRPGGSLIAYCGQIQLPDVLQLMSQHLRYWWVNACLHGGALNQMNKYGIRVGWKPMVWFVKGSRGDVQTMLVDTVSGGQEKKHHAWQQSQGEAEYYIDRLCSPGGIVWEPFAGGGTTIAACKKLDRKWIACEISEIAAAEIAKRVAA